MRHLAFAALSAAVVLSACSERRETPTEPGVLLASAKKDATGSCLSPFPLGVSTSPVSDLQTQVDAMFAGSPNHNAAKAKLRSIKSQCENGKVGNARHEAATFVDWMVKKYGQGALPDGSALGLGGLISDVFIAVGGAGGGIDPGAFGPEGAVGYYSGEEDFLLRNANMTAAVKINAHCLPPSLITIIRLPDSPQLTNTGGRPQFPPFYDINAANEEGRHTIFGTCDDLLVGFCVTQAVLDQTTNPQIGHNKAADPTQEEEGGEFEVLRAANSGEYEELRLEFCPGQANGFEDFRLGNASGLGDLVLYAWHSYVRPLTDIFLPQQLHATALGGLGLGGGGRSISPFGVVDDNSECEGCCEEYC